MSDTPVSSEISESPDVTTSEDSSPISTEPTKRSFESKREQWLNDHGDDDNQTEEEAPKPRKDANPVVKHEEESVSNKDKPAPKKEQLKKEPVKEQPKEEPEPPKETEAQKARRIKLKVNGQERELTEEEVIRRAQLADSADEKFRAASEQTKQWQQLMEQAKQDPRALFKQLGINEREWAEDYLTSELQREMMDPQQRELEELRQFKQQQETRREKQEHEAQEQQQQAELKQLQQKYAREFDEKITTTLENAKLPKTPLTVKRTVDLMQSALANGFDLDPQMAADEVSRQYQDDIQSLVGELDGDDLVNFLGQDIIKKIRKYDLGKLRAKQRPQGEPAAQSPVRPQSNRPKQRTMSRDEWKAELRKKAGVSADY